MKTRTLKLIGLCCAIAWALAGCVQKEMPMYDETMNQIALCTGGIASDSGLNVRIKAEIDKKRKLVGNAGINYAEIIKGVIFQDQSISEDLKKFYYDKYLACLRDARNRATKKKFIISRVYILDERYVTHAEGETAVSRLEHRDNQQFIVNKDALDSLAVVLLFEVEGFKEDDSRIHLDGDVRFKHGSKEVAHAPLKALFRINDWKKKKLVSSVGIEQVMKFMGYGEESVSRRIPYLLIVHDFQEDEAPDGDIEISIAVKDILSGQSDSKQLHVQFRHR